MAAFRRSREVAPNAIVGAARRVHLNRREEVAQLRERSTEEWQKLAWRYYDEIGEVKYAFNYFAAVASRIRFYVGYQEEAGEAPVPIGKMGGLSRSFVTASRYELSKLNQGVGGQPNLIRQFVLNLLVAGEGYLVGSHDSWACRSTSELQFEGDRRIRLVTSRAVKRASGRYLPESAFVARVWRPHPEYSDDADSSLRGVRNACAELLLLSRIIASSGSSRLNAGILYVADELRFQRSSDPVDMEPSPDVDPFEEELTVALTEPIGLTDSPSEVVPMIIRGPAALAETALKHIDLSRGFDKTIVERHDQTLDRVLNGLDIPRDLVSGLANVRYSNAKVITEDLLKSHVEPIILLLCEALTTVFLRQQLKARGYSDDIVNKTVVWYDPSEVVVKPDRSEDADKGYGRMLISASTWRRSHGFSDKDAPTDDELALRIALSGSVAPSTTLDFLRQIAPDLVTEAERLAQASFGDPSLATNGQPAEAQQSQPPASPTEQPAETQPAIGETAPSAPTPEPPEGELPPQIAASAQHQAQVIKMLREFASQRQKSSSVVRDHTRKLERTLEVERRLRESLSVHLNDVVKRSLERAGARTVSKTRGDAGLKALVSDVPMEVVFSVVPEARLAEFALDPEKLVRDTIERAKTGYVDLVTRAQDQGWKALGRDVFERMKPRQAAFIENSWKWLVKKLVQLAVGWLKKPRTEGNYVPMTTVRTAQAIAGGASNANERRFGGPMNSGKAVLSPVVIDTLQDEGWAFSDRYRWVYGVSENSYLPHVKLDDKIFASWEARELASKDAEEWPYVTHYFPGDHNGCRCDWLPEVLDPAEVNAPVRGQTWDDMPIAASGDLVDTNASDAIQFSRNGVHPPVHEETRK
jgi:hypothetical protein